MKWNTSFHLVKVVTFNKQTTAFQEKKEQWQAKCNNRMCPKVETSPCFLTWSCHSCLQLLSQRLPQLLPLWLTQFQLFLRVQNVSPCNLAQALKGVKIKIQFVFSVHRLAYSSLLQKVTFLLHIFFFLPLFMGVGWVILGGICCCFYSFSHHFWYKKLWNILPFGTFF